MQIVGSFVYLTVKLFVVNVIDEAMMKRWNGSVDRLVGSIRLLVLTWMLLPVALVWAEVPTTSMGGESAVIFVCRGVVLDASTNEPLSMVAVTVEGTNIATVTNKEGAFTLNLPVALENGTLVVSHLGYERSSYPLIRFKSAMQRVALKVKAVALPEVNVVYKDAESLVQAMLDKRKDNYMTVPTHMTAFYRETIRKRKTYVSLLESVVDVLKMPYTSLRNDVASLYKVRKNTDYSKLDTLVFKLMGGPYNTLFTDVMKSPEDVFSEDVFARYVFSFDRSTRINNRLVYVLNFKQRPHIVDPFFFGKLYIDTETLALVSAVYDMDLSNRAKVNELFVRRKPLNAKVNVTKARYHVGYLLRDGKWYLGYSRVEMDVAIDWKRRLFNTNYESVMEMAVTDWSVDVPSDWNRSGTRLRSSVVIADAVSGFADVDFWGASNVIEPDKSIESAISKIRKRLE